MKATSFQVVHWSERDEEGKQREAILVYALGEDGNIYELANGRWTRLAIKDAIEFVPIPRKQAGVISKEIKT